MPKQIDSSYVPAHIGLILDGNRRWAKAQGLPTLQGHQKGAEVLKNISAAAFRQGVKYLSAYVFSTENWQRTQEEVGYLMGLVGKVTEQYLDEVHQEGIRIRVIGSREGLNKAVLKALEKAEQKTLTNTKGQIILCFNYGGQQEIADAAKQLIADNVPAEQITPQTITERLYAPDVPPIDLLVRTSGEQRISNFMLWRVAYSELYFSPKLWPDFTEADLNAALKEYAERHRRFGK